MKDNQLLKRKLKLTKEQAENKPATLLFEWLKNETSIYSYYIKLNASTGDFEVNVNISQIPEYNTIIVQEAIINMVDNLSRHSNEFIIGYQQPPLEMMVQTYEPYVKSLAMKMARQWNLEFDDMVQTCYLVMVTLYNQGYYLNSGLLKRSFVSKVLGDLRYLNAGKRGGNVVTVSLEAERHNTTVKYGDTIDDPEQLHQLEIIDDEDAEQQAFNKNRADVINDIGERQYKSLLDALESGTLTVSQRNYLRRIGNRIKKRWKNCE